MYEPEKSVYHGFIHTYLASFAYRAHSGTSPVLVCVVQESMGWMPFRAAPKASQGKLLGFREVFISKCIDGQI